MGQMNAEKNRAVWVDIPVADLDRATNFYAKVLNVPVTQEEFDGFKFSVIDHDEGNGGCLVPNADQITSTGGLLVYMNTNGRIRDAVTQVTESGGNVIDDVHSIGPHGFRAIVLDSEGNRIALHSDSDA